MLLRISAVFGSTVGQHPAHTNVMFLKEWKNTIVEQICGSYRRLLLVQLGKGNFAIRVNEGLLIDAANAFERANVERVLSTAVTRTFAFEFAVSILFVLRLLKRCELRFGENQAFLCALGLKGFKPFLHRLELIRFGGHFRL